jgi:phosphoserine aminotransferase|mmetsp:Transcript_6311/g.8425  ORF Transcript_6311/g.8425 Transcript_6311/m.8425 type:complete len:380 (+) Transcript_6311:211-1350(+)|eukprot:CAMPEP_0185570258 /NCGR_PEP_ID=MMETSP0434-20130131/2633_1 /TAXON_ID=626734 ORGANISM="Favella taraikaensis, Strain Fe Narragansett Bay" /NCGR_SAMPLE_ID=MMETSP0434 /ASSEMBLY_ACC=CAM_ASM_000379 /LENGTH=379 /DNA_ID=CAMNT_0028185327 /DNA_START=196 /DNA_END=1335 /DNA_ORIENTATION=+
MAEAQDAPKTVYNFSAGPCCLPKEVLREAQADLVDYKGTGVSVMEMSHRSKTFTGIADKAREDVRRLLSVPDNFTIFMFQGGASLQFAAICYNLLEDGERQSANYLTTGTWSQGAIDEARKYCNPNEVANNKPSGYTTIAEPADWNIDASAKFFHYCDNETIQGFEFGDGFPFDRVPEGQTLVCDMSSNFLSREVDWSKYGVVYAGAQKNVGPAGATIVIVRNDLIAGHRSDTPLLCDWETFSKAANTFHNTPACFPIYVCGLNLAYMIEQGGVPAMKAKAIERSSLLYDFIDNSDGYYVNRVEGRFRSRINIPFRVCSNDELEAKFLAEAAKVNLIDLKGHRSVGGIRASLYNAMPVEGVHALIAFMGTFKENNPAPQ